MCFTTTLCTLLIIATYLISLYNQHSTFFQLLLKHLVVNLTPTEADRPQKHPWVLCPSAQRSNKDNEDIFCVCMFQCWPSESASSIHHIHHVPCRHTRCSLLLCVCGLMCPDLMTKIISFYKTKAYGTKRIEQLSKNCNNHFVLIWPAVTSNLFCKHFYNYII